MKFKVGLAQIGPTLGNLEANEKIIRGGVKKALKLGVDWIALSFVQRPEDILEARKLIKDKARLISKLEKPAAIEALHAIVDLSDAIMIARGDLGVEIPLQDVPPLQKKIIRVCRDAGKPVIVATQMLDSMVNAPSPTRAEASDVSTAIYDGADAVMLSEESAAGKYPVDAVKMMNKIIIRTEKDELYRSFLFGHVPPVRNTDADAITSSAKSAAEAIGASAIVTYTTSGGSARVASRQRASVPIVGITSMLQTARYLTLVWGVHPVHTIDARNFEEMVDIACTVAPREGFGVAGQELVIIAGTPFGTPGATNVLRIARIEEKHVRASRRVPPKKSSTKRGKKRKTHAA